jgi:hypothetical protein
MSESLEVLVCILGDGALTIYVHTQARKFDKGSSSYDDLKELMILTEISRRTATREHSLVAAKGR